MENQRIILQFKDCNEKPDAPELRVCTLDAKETAISHRNPATVAQANEALSTQSSESDSDLRFLPERITEGLPSFTQKARGADKYAQAIIFFSLILSAVCGLSVGFATGSFNTGFAVGTGSLEIFRAIRELIWVGKDSKQQRADVETNDDR